MSHSHCAHFNVLRFIFVYAYFGVHSVTSDIERLRKTITYLLTYYDNMMRWTRWYWSL